MRAACRTALVALLATSAAQAGAGERPSNDTYALGGAGTLSVPAAPQSAGRFVLRAGVEAAGGGASMQAAGRFVLAGTASANSLVCYDDTLFRDSFDGTGL